jgi:phage gpG-like protein
MTATIRTEEVERGIRNVSEKIDSGELLLRVGYKVETHAKMNASGRPGPNVRTGRLRASITTELSPDRDECVVGTNVYYAPFVELGHRQQVGRFVPAIGKRLKNPFAPAYPFMMPALDQTVMGGEMDGVFGTFCNEIERAWIA